MVLAIREAAPSAPLEDPACRRAVFAAIDRLSLAEDHASDGPDWIPAYALSPPGLASYDADYRQFPDGQGRGDLAQARSDLTACGWPAGFGMRIAVLPGAEASVEALQSGLERVGITVQPAGEGPADAVLLVVQAREPGVVAFFDPLARKGPAGDLGLTAVQTLLDSDLGGDPGMEREQGRMIDRMLLSTLRYLPLIAERAPGVERG